MRARYAGFFLSVMLMLSLSGCGGGHLVRQADSLVERGRYTEAMEYYRKALAGSPRSRKLQARLDNAKRLECQRLMAMGATRLAARDPERAFDLYADATRYDPSNQKAREGLVQARDLWVERAQGLERDGRFNEALVIHERVLREFAQFQISRDAIGRMTDDLSVRARDAASAYLQNGRPGNALVELLRAQRYRPGDEALAASVEQARQSIRASAVFPVDIYARAKSLYTGPLWAIFLGGRFEERGLPITVQSGKGSGSLQVELYGVPGVVTRRSARIMATGVMQSTAMRPNPAWVNLKAKVDLAEGKAKTLEIPVREAEAALDAMLQERRRTGAGATEEAEELQRRKVAEATRAYRAAMDEFETLSKLLAPLPKERPEQVSQDYTYPAEEVTASLRLSGEVVFSNRDGTVLKRLPLDETFSAKDQTNPRLAATPTRPEVPADPLVLPDEQSLRVQAESKAMSQVEAIVEEFFVREVNQRWADARRLAVSGKTEAAVEAFLRAYVSDPRQSADEAIRYITDARQAVGLPLLETLLLPASPPQASLREDQ